MGIYIGNPVWQDDIYQFEETDVVRGGPGGIDNVPLKDLADRTTWLKENAGRIKRFAGIAEITAGANPVINAALALNQIKIIATDNLTVNLDAVASFAPGQIVAITSRCVAFKAITIQCNGADLIQDGLNDRAKMFMCDHERLWLVAAGNHWEISFTDGNFWTAGDSFIDRKQRGNTAILQGQEVLRADFPRVWEYCAGLTLGGELVTEALWQSNNDIFKSCFSLGNGVTSFRFPDERGMFFRVLDLGRGIDYDRVHNYAGGLEMDALKDHVHFTDLNPNANSASGAGKVTVGADGPEGQLPRYKSTGPLDPITLAYAGATETRPKNIGKIPLIKY